MNTADDIINNINNSKYFTKLDLCKGYWEIPMYPADTDMQRILTNSHVPAGIAA